LSGVIEGWQHVAGIVQPVSPAIGMSHSSRDRPAIPCSKIKEAHAAGSRSFDVLPNNPLQRTCRKVTHFAKSKMRAISARR
jgi:hypothetical protein